MKEFSSSQHMSLENNKKYYQYGLIFLFSIDTVFFIRKFNFFNVFFINNIYIILILFICIE